MVKKLRVGILFGGRSGEHEVSLLSAASVLRAIDRHKFDVTPIGITREGRWLAAADADLLLHGDMNTGDLTTATRPLRAGDPSATPGAKLLHEGIPTLLVPEPRSTALSGNRGPGGQEKPLDVVFPVLHGTFGEDGTIQGLFELAGIAYVGSGVLGSAAGMDKDVMKRLFVQAGLPIVKHVTLLRADWEKDPRKAIAQVEKSLKYPLFVKPANLGSSVGITKVHGRSELAPAMSLAAGFDRKLVVEQGVGGPGVKPREFEVAVLGNDAPEASLVGEIVPNKEFYDYESKYESSENPSIPIIPAKLTLAQSKQIRAMALAAFRACDCSGLARVDFLMEPARDAKGRRIPKPRIFLNEINTMPGFTSISMYPKLWQASGLPYRKLIDRLISLALERHREKQQTRFTKS